MKLRRRQGTNDTQPSMSCTTVQTFPFGPVVSKEGCEDAKQ